MKKHYPLISVVILTYNGEKYIQNLLDSLLRQSYPSQSIEIIVVDNASFDNTKDIIKADYPNIRLIELEKNYGFAGGNNRAIAHAAGEYLFFINQDTVCHRDCLINLIDFMLLNKEITACNANIVTQSPENTSEELEKTTNTITYCDLSPFGYGTFKKSSTTSHLTTRLLSGCAFAIHRTSLDQLGYLFDEDFWMYAEDTDLSLRILNSGGEMGVVGGALVYHLHKNAISINRKTFDAIINAIQNRLFAFYKNMSSIEFIFFLPLLILGGGFKVFEFQLSTAKKFLLFIPFSVLSIFSMLSALLYLKKFTGKKRAILEKRHGNDFFIIKQVTMASSLKKTNNK